MENKMDENVLVIKAHHLKESINLPKSGFVKLSDLDFLDNKTLFIKRSIAENDPNYKQIIPYCIVRNDKGILVVKRTQRQSEKRLHNKISIGIGGHINDCDTGEDIIKKAMYRELFEEVHIDYKDIISVKTIGFINDDTNDVGKVHIGVVFEIITHSELCIKETDKMIGEIQDPSVLVNLQDDMETWSKIVFENYYEEI